VTFLLTANMSDDETFLYLRSPNSPKGSRRRVRAMFVCPSCGWRLQAMLEQELTTVRCECEAQFQVRKPVKRASTNQPASPNVSRPPLRSILQQLSRGETNPRGAMSDTDSMSGSVQSVMVSHCSSASSAVVSISAPSVVSISSAASAATAERRGSASSGGTGLKEAQVTQGTRVMLVPQAVGERAEAGEASAQAAPPRGGKGAKPTEAAASASEASQLWLPLPSIVEGGWLGQMFAHTSISSPK